jgi:hypothetical protein
MTEVEWLACNDPDRMLEFLKDRARKRKLQLFACACCRRAWHLLPDGRTRQALETAERFTEGLATKDELEAAEVDAENAADDYYGAAVAVWTTVTAIGASPVSVCHFVTLAAYEAAEALRDASAKSPKPTIATTWDAVRKPAEYAKRTAWDSERKQQADLLRDLFGNPFRPMPTIDSDWPAWNGGTVRRIAQGIYDELAFNRLPILADALEEAGCDNADILAHCRDGGEHVRGCWVVDLLLGKQ